MCNSVPVVWIASQVPQLSFQDKTVLSAQHKNVSGDRTALRSLQRKQMDHRTGAPKEVEQMPKPQCLVEMCHG